MEKHVNNILLALFGFLLLPFIGIALTFEWELILKLFFINLIVQLIALGLIVYGFPRTKDRNVKVLYSLYFLVIILYYVAAVMTASAPTDIHSS